MLEPRIFLSYSRTDADSGNALRESLASKGCRVWMDTREVLVGDDFVRHLTRELDRNDGLVYLLTHDSAKSSWCQAEVQRALTRGMNVAVVQRDEHSHLPEAVERLLRDVQRVSYNDALTGLADHIHRARKRRLSRWLKTAALWLALLAIVVSIAWIAVNALNERQSQERVSAVVSQIVESKGLLSGADLQKRLASVATEPSLIPSLNDVRKDKSESPYARANAWQAINWLEHPTSKSRNDIFENVEWSGGRLTSGTWDAATYRSGRIQDLQVLGTRMIGLAFDAGPSDSRKGMSIIASTIQDADIWFMRLFGTQLIDVKFINSKFRAAQLDLSGGAAVLFQSKRASDNVVTDELTLFEDSLIIQSRSLPEAGTLDLSTPEQELLFDNVQFLRVRFEGNFKPQWFKNSHFENCVFATSMTISELEKFGNTEEGSLVVPPSK